MKWIINKLFWIWSLFPVLALTCDDNFINFELGKGLKPRFSVLSFTVGEFAFFFISYDFKEKKFSILCRKKLSEYARFLLDDAKCAQLHEDYNKHLNKISPEDVVVEKEALQNHITYEEGRIDTSNQKINIYTTIILTVIPLILAMVEWNDLYGLSIANGIVVGYLIYAIINICCFIFSAVQVRELWRSTFGDLKASADKKKEIVWQLYYDWQQLRRKADLFVSYVKKTQEWAVVILLASAIAVGIRFVPDNGVVESKEDNQIYTIDVEELKSIYSKSSVDFAEVMVCLKKEMYTRVVVISNGAELADIKEELKEYDRQEFVWLVDSELNSNTIKIILEE